MSLEKLKELGEDLREEPVDYRTAGVHHLYEAKLAAIPTIAQIFHDAGYCAAMITCLDVRKTENAFRLVYHFGRPSPADRHRIKATVPTGEDAPSIALIFESANWYEREVYDMFGVRFSGHPYLHRILTEEGAEYHPLLKDFGVAEPAAQEPADA